MKMPSDLWGWLQRANESLDLPLARGQRPLSHASTT